MRMRGPSFKKFVMKELKIKNPRSYIPDPKKELHKGIKSGCGCLVFFGFRNCNFCYSNRIEIIDSVKMKKGQTWFNPSPFVPIIPTCPLPLN